jgi:uncharacterized protein
MAASDGGGLTVNEETVIRRTADHVRGLLTGEGSGHDWWHIERVRRMALRIAQEEGADRFIVELAALLHDVADHKFHGGDLQAGPRAARTWLEGIGVERGTVDLVCEIVEGVSFKGAGVPTPMRTVEGKAVQDADRLDAMGAIGVARAFAYGGSKGRALHEPAAAPEQHGSFEAYSGSTGSTVNHFHEKLLLLKDRMQTGAGKRLADDRHRYMIEYLDRFLAEWSGER